MRNHLRTPATAAGDQSGGPRTDADAKPPYLAPVVVSARNNWIVVEKGLAIFERGHLLDGARRLSVSVQTSPEVKLPVLVLLGLSADEEAESRAWFRPCQSETREGSDPTFRERVGTDTPRLRVGEPWTDVMVASEPFVVPTTRGYAPAILVKRRSTTYREHLLIGARSISLPLEELRASVGELTGQHLSIRKTAAHQSAPYEVKIRL